MLIYPIKSKKFVLRTLRRSDASNIAKNAHDKEIYRNTLSIPYPYKLKDAEIWIEDTLKKEKKKNREGMTLVVEIEGEAAGVISLNKIKGHSAEIGYWLGRKYWGRGIMTKAVKIVTKIGFSEFKLRRIFGHVLAFNDGSAKVLRKSGYKLEGTLRKRFKKNDKILDAYLFAKVR